MSIEPYNTYILVNVKSGTALDLSGTDGYTVSGWERHGGENQRASPCIITEVWTFRNVYSGKYLGLAELSELRDDIPIQGVDYPVPWDIFEDELDRSTYRIVVPETSFNVDLSNFGDPNNGTLVAIWGQWEALNQTWRFEQGCKYTMDIFVCHAEETSGYFRPSDDAVSSLQNSACAHISHHRSLISFRLDQYWTTRGFKHHSDSSEL
ncbi:hypothetical protein E4T56_gene11791 [Termitomyces sp. T112]|nr:hypothetical protein E4T56_gene11791 [Termitomyces sp. T112]